MGLQRGDAPFAMGAGTAFPRKGIYERSEPLRASSPERAIGRKAEALLNEV